MTAAKNRLYVPKQYRNASGHISLRDTPLNNRAVPLWITDTAGNADTLASKEHACVALPESGWCGENGQPLGDWDDIALNDRTAMLAVDRSWSLTGRHKAIGMFLRRRGVADIRYLWLPSETTKLAEHLANGAEFDVRTQIQPALFEDQVAAQVDWLRVREEARRRFDEEQRLHDGGNTWAPVDLGPYLRGEIKPPQPTLGLRRRGDGLQFLYPGREHAVIGETESGKPWFALGCVAAEILAGNPVLYVHYEEPDPASTIERLELIGIGAADIDQHLVFVGPSEPVTPERIEALLTPAPTLVVHDGVNEAFALIGAKQDVDGAAEFRRRLIRPCLLTGAAVLSCDHLPMGDNTGRRDAYGTVGKGNGLDGARFILENFEPFGRGMRGASNVYVTKDRPGHLRDHGLPTETPGKTRMGVLVVDDSRHPFEPFELVLFAPKDHSDDPAAEVVDALTDDVYQVIYAQPDHAVASLRDLYKHMRAAECGAEESTVRKAAEDLEVAGRLIELRGKNRSIGYQAVSSAAEGSQQ